MATMYNACPSCEGYGLIKNLEAAALAALRKLQTRSTRGDVGRIRVTLPSDVATWMLNNKRDDLVQIERRHDLRIEVEPGGKLLRHQVEFETSPREKAAEPPPRPADEAAPASEEKKAWSLIDAGYDGSVNGEAYSSVYFQNGNHSVRVTDDFMRAVVDDAEWHTIARTTGEPMDGFRARDLMGRISTAAHQ